MLAENSLLIISIESPPSNGSVTLNSDGTFIYQHNGSGILQDSFTYRVTNEDDVFAIATVEISVEPPLANAFEKPVIITPAEPFTPEPEPEPEIDTSTVEDIPVEESAGDSEFNFEFNAIERAAQNRTDSTELDVVLPINEIDLSDRNELFEELSTLADLAVRQHNEIQTADLNLQSATFNTTDIEFFIGVKTNSAHEVVSNASFAQALDQLGQDLTNTDTFERRRYEIASDAAIGVSISTTAGVLAWALRGGALFASVMASTPLWSSINPVRLVGGLGDKSEDDTDESDVESYFSENQK